MIFLGSFAVAQAQTNLPLPGGTTIVRGQKYFSQSGNYYLLFGADGNLTVNTSANVRVWGLNQVFPNFSSAGRVEMQTDGNLVVKTASGGFLWSALSQNTDRRSQLLVNKNGALQLVASGSRVFWSSDGNLTSTEIFPDYGWTYCKSIADPKIMIMGSRAVTQSAMDAVAYIYTEMTKRFTPKYPKNKFDGYIIYMTNGEPWSELSNLAPIGTMMIDKNGVNIGDELRGGTSPNYLWISEQMICKKGVKTRNDAFAAGTRAERDDTERTFDQVIHEFGHAIDFKFGLRARILAVYNGGWDPVEQFPWSIQHWFGAPSGTLSTSENSFIGEIFSSKTTFPSDIYSMSSLLKVTIPSGEVIYASPVDNNPSVQWGTLTDLNALNNLPNFDAADKDFNGKTNTEAIVAQLGNNGGTAYAAKVCADLNVNGFMGFKDWYLPASGELNELYKKLGPLANGGSGQITSGVYWSSSERMNSHAWIRYFNNGNQDIFDKGNKTKCRCVRK